MARIKAEEAEYLRSKGIESPEEIEAYLARAKQKNELKEGELTPDQYRKELAEWQEKSKQVDEIKDADLDIGEVAPVTMTDIENEFMYLNAREFFSIKKDGSFKPKTPKQLAESDWKFFSEGDNFKQSEYGIKKENFILAYKKVLAGEEPPPSKFKKDDYRYGADIEDAISFAETARSNIDKVAEGKIKAEAKRDQKIADLRKQARAKLKKEVVGEKPLAPLPKGLAQIDTKIKQRLKAIEKDIETLQQKFDKVNVFASLSRADLEAAAMDAVNNIKGTPLGQLPYNKLPDDSVFTTGALKQRALDIPHLKVAGWLENDINAITRSYNRTVAPQIEIARDYGDLGMSKALNDVKADYDFMRADVREEMLEAGASKEAIGKKLLSLQKKQESDLRDLIAMRDKLLGVYGQPADPNDVWFRVGHFAKQLNFLRLLGQSGISPIEGVTIISSTCFVIADFIAVAARLSSQSAIFGIQLSPDSSPCFLNCAIILSAMSSLMPAFANSLTSRLEALPVILEAIALNMLSCTTMPLNPFRASFHGVIRVTLP